MAQSIKCLSLGLEDLSLISRAREMALSLACLPQGHKDPDSIPVTHIKNQVWGPVPVIPELGRRRQKGGSLQLNGWYCS